jgi:hypothetical protein
MKALTDSLFWLLSGAREHLVDNFLGSGVTFLVFLRRPTFQDLFHRLGKRPEYHQLLTPPAAVQRGRILCM